MSASWGVDFWNFVWILCKGINKTKRGKMRCGWDWRVPGLSLENEVQFNTYQNEECCEMSASYWNHLSFSHLNEAWKSKYPSSLFKWSIETADALGGTKPTVKEEVGNVERNSLYCGAAAASYSAPGIALSRMGRNPSVGLASYLPLDPFYVAM